MANNFPPYPRVVKPASEPLALYLYPGYNDHSEILHLLSSGESGFFGAVLNPVHAKAQKELREQLVKHRLEVVLDPQTQQSATVGGYSDGLGKLPWGVGRPHAQTDFIGTQGLRLVSELAAYAVAQGYTQVLAPTHLIRSSDDEWLPIDIQATRRLRDQLDKRGGSGITVVFPLTVTYAALRDPEQRHQIIAQLVGLPVSAIWLKVESFGSTCTGVGAKTYLEIAAEFQKLGLPLVADHIGGAAGLALLAFGAVGGIAHGVTSGERFSASHWNRPRADNFISGGRRVYIPEINLVLKRVQAKLILEHSPYAKGQFGCKDTSCCPRGVIDMLENPGHHFLYQRIQEVGALSRIPQHLRADQFLENHLKPKTYAALTASNMELGDPLIEKKLKDNRKHLDRLLIVLRQHMQSSPIRTFARVPTRKVARVPFGLSPTSPSRPNLTIV